MEITDVGADTKSKILFKLLDWIEGCCWKSDISNKVLSISELNKFDMLATLSLVKVSKSPNSLLFLLFLLTVDNEADVFLVLKIKLLFKFFNF